MTISAKLQTINTALGDIKDAIISKGQTPSGNITTYATAISNIASGGETIQATNQTGSNISEGDKVWVKKTADTVNVVSNYNLVTYSSIDNTSLTGFANENITNNSSGAVKTLLPPEISVSVTANADDATITLE